MRRVRLLASESKTIQKTIISLKTQGSLKHLRSKEGNVFMRFLVHCTSFHLHFSLKKLKTFQDDFLFL